MQRCIITLSLIMLTLRVVILICLNPSRVVVKLTLVFNKYILFREIKVIRKRPALNTKQTVVFLILFMKNVVVV